MSLFDCVDEAPRDPILGLTELFNADTHPAKINLSVGVYLNEEGTIPVLNCVKQAETIVLNSGKPRAYLPIQGADAYCRAVQTLLFGNHSDLVQQGRVLTIQTLGGTGGLKVGADFLKRFFPNTQVAISDPSWENHRALFEFAGLPVTTYAYYDKITHGVAMTSLLASLNSLPKHSIVVLHACCHNPTGVDLSKVQWLEVLDVCKTRDLIPFIDMAYQGFGEDIESDAEVVRLFANSGLTVLISNSFSKSFSLYGERVGALSIVTRDDNESRRVLSQIKRTIRTNYSNPPMHGSALVSTILMTPSLRALWEKELAEMRHRIQFMRTAFVDKLNQLNPTVDFSFIKTQQGMFSYSGLTQAQASDLKHTHGIYILPTGRLCIAALNQNNINTVVQAIASVLNQ
jgi:aromatic-amino-acid transaminase